MFQRIVLHVRRSSIGNSHYRLIFDLDKINPDEKNEIPQKNLSKVVKFKNLVENVVMCGKYSLTKFANFRIIVLGAEIDTTFGSKMVAISARNTIMRKFVNFVRLYLLHITIFFNQILGFYYF